MAGGAGDEARCRAALLVEDTGLCEKERLDACVLKQDHG